jgi:putative transcriptional regulator
VPVGIADEAAPAALSPPGCGSIVIGSAMAKTPRRPKSSLKGRFLLDGGTLTGTFFHRTVVLVCEHNAEGAFGLVLNRPSGSQLDDVLSVDVPPRLQGMPIFNGGPVQPAALSYLVNHPALKGGNVLPRLVLGHDLEALLQLAAEPAKDLRLRTFAGYAGWAPGQLDDEVARNSWIIRKATLDLIFQEPAESLWREVLRHSRDWRDRLLGDSPDSLSRN